MSTLQFTLTTQNQRTPAWRIQQRDPQFGGAQWGRQSIFYSRSAAATASASVRYDKGVMLSDGTIKWIAGTGGDIDSVASAAGTVVRHNDPDCNVGTLFSCVLTSANNTGGVIVNPVGGFLEIVE